MRQNESITPQHIMAIRRLNLQLEDFVKVGLRDEINFSKINADLTFGLVAQQALYDLERLALFPERPAKKNSDKGPDPLELAYDRYIEFVSHHSVSAVAKQPPVDVGFFEKDRIQFVLEAKGLKYPDLVLLDDAEDPVVRAWNVARANRRRGLQRVGAFFFLSSQVPSGLYGDQRARLDAEGLAVVQFLFNRAADFHATEMKFALLLGGEALSLSKADIVQDSFGPDMAIIQYLHPDERHPGQYRVKDADDFRDKVKDYAGMTQ